MRLRNKKTGEVIDLDIANIKAQFGGISVIPEPVKLGGDEHVYHSLAELNADWEDYKPTEPLIKDEKIRKAVRAWAEANDINSEHYHNTDIKFNATEHRLQWIQTSIEFNNIMGFDNLEDGETYTIDELCGEEEECKR